MKIYPMEYSEDKRVEYSKTSYEEEYNKGIEEINRFLQLPDIEDTKEKTSVYTLYCILKRYFDPFFTELSTCPISMNSESSLTDEVSIIPQLISKEELRIFIKIETSGGFAFTNTKYYVLNKEYGHSPIYYDEEHFNDTLNPEKKHTSSDYHKEHFNEVIFNLKEKIEKTFQIMEQYHTWNDYLGVWNDKEEDQPYVYYDRIPYQSKYLYFYSTIKLNGNGNVTYTVEFNRIPEEYLKAKRLDGKDSLWSILESNKEAIAKKTPVDFSKLDVKFQQLYQIYYNSFDKIEDNTPKTYKLS